MTYLDEAAELLRKARDANEVRGSMTGDPNRRQVVNEERLRIAAAFERLAAIERGITPPGYTRLAAEAEREGDERDH